jgi:pimeloyl-ACP methyl ester carboxylesterase
MAGRWVRGGLPVLPTPGVPRVDPPWREETVRVGPGRKRSLGIAHFGDPDGRVVLWFHGTPGGRRQFPLVGRRAAIELGFHVVLVARPGSGVSTAHLYRAIFDWATDAGAVADHLGHDRFAVVGLSGGGPYALAAAAGFPDRVVAAGILGGVCPLVGPDASGVPGGLIGLATRFRPLLGPMRPVLGGFLFGAVQPIIPLAHPVYQRFARLMPAGDQVVFADPEIEGMFIDDLLDASRHRFSAAANDALLFSRDWGFQLADVTVPVRWWHGDADTFVPLAAAQHAVEVLPNAELFLRPGESHLGGFAVADDVLAVIDSLWVD